LNKYQKCIFGKMFALLKEKMLEPKEKVEDQGHARAQSAPEINTNPLLKKKLSFRLREKKEEVKSPAGVNPISSWNEDEKLDYFLKIIPSKALEDETVWIKVGKVLLSMRGTTGLATFIDKSQGVHDEGKCREIWSTFKEGLPLKYLAWLAREYSGTAYFEWHYPWVDEAVKSACVEVGDLEVVLILYRFFWLDFAFDNKKGWLSFDGSSYAEGDGMARLLTLLEERLLPFLGRYGTKLETNLTYGGESRDLQKRIANLRKVIKLLGSEVSRSRILSFSQELFYVETSSM
jgi:hypothetical protein